MMGQAFFATIWSQYDLSTQTISTVPVYDSGYIYLVCLACGAMAGL